MWSPEKQNTLKSFAQDTYFEAFGFQVILSHFFFVTL